MSARGEIDIQTGPAFFPLYYYTGAPDRSSFSPVQAAYAAPQSSSTVALSLFVIPAAYVSPRSPRALQ